MGCQSSFNEFQKINSSDIGKLISAAANKQCELDPAPTWLVKKFSNELSPFIAVLFNSSMSTGTFPSSQKCAVVTPILKKSTLDPNDTANYRPVSNLTFLSKLLERAAHHQLMEYINLNNLLPDVQSAYRRNRSTETAVLRVLSDAYLAADRGLVTLLGFLDLSAAFDTVDHHILIKRMHNTFGIGDCALKWITSYMDKRTQFVRFGGTVSATTMVIAGVPQGSVLGPALFICYTSGVIKIIIDAGLNVHAYADDLQIYGHSSTSDAMRLAAVMSSCIETVNTWMASNRLRLNPSKTEFIWLGSSRRLENIPSDPITVSGVNIPISKNVRDLGIYIDGALSLDVHVNNVVRLCFFHLRQLRLIRRSLTVDAAHYLVRALIHSRLDYCNSIMAGIQKHQLDRLQSVLKAAARFVLRLPSRAHVSELMRERLHWLDINHRIVYKLGVLAYKCQHNLSPTYLSALCISSTTVPERASLRSSDVLTLIVPRTETKTIGPRGFFFAGPSTWNSLPTNSRNHDISISVFKNHLKTFLFNQYRNP